MPLRLAVAAAALCLCHAAPVPQSTAPATSSKVSSPFSLFTKGLPQEKRKPFMEVMWHLGLQLTALMKQLRSSKQAPGSKEDKKKVAMSLDGEIHKLLGDDYKKYRLITEKIKSLHSAKKSDELSSSPPPPPPA
ncbi:MAG: hypothetical protein SGPRY_005642, partial [Prymnesium sp.]